MEFKGTVPASESSLIDFDSQAQIDVARRQIVEEPSLVGRIKTRRNLFRLTHAQIQQSMRMGWDVIERAKSSSNSTSRFDGPLDWDFMYSLSGKNSLRPPVYEDHVPGLKSTVQVNSDDVFASLKTESGFGKGSGRNGSEKDDKAGSDFDDLLAGLGSDRHAPNIGLSSEPTISASKTTSTAAEDPFKVLESTSAPMDSSTSNFTDPFEEISKFSDSRSTKNNSSSTSNGIIYEDTDPFDGLGRSVPALSSQRNSSKGFRF